MTNFEKIKAELTERFLAEMLCEYIDCHNCGFHEKRCTMFGKCPFIYVKECEKWLKEQK